MKKVTKAVIPAAGLGTRVLPATKAMPKGMLPIVDKPAIQYLVEEAVRSGITDILIILGRNQSIIEDHFDRSPELEEKLAAPGKEKMLEECLGIANMANIYFVRQKQTLGLGHAVSVAKAFTGDDPFVVIYGDDVIWGEDPVCAQLIRAYEEFGRPAAGVSAVPWADVSRYCSLKTTPIHDNYFFVDDMIEKPKKGQEFMNSLPGQLSGGQQQRVAIARALATKPAILLADEPTGNLDSRTSQDVLSLMKVTGRKFSQTMVMITHNEEIAQLSDRIVRIEDGRIVTQ